MEILRSAIGPEIEITNLVTHVVICIENKNRKPKIEEIKRKTQ